ncbi:hypothetical protein FACS1894216_04360 [Synergistales bacterium]|nr:hypothetical protein FACS1894216_04360 [Synergistales bacterium]
MELNTTKLLLVIPFFSAGGHAFSSITSGAAYINAALRNHGFNVECFCMSGETDNPIELLKAEIIESKTDVVLCGGLTFQYKALKSIFDAAKEANRDILTIGGGGGFTSEPILFSDMCGVDYAVIGEGEITICELIDAIICGSEVAKVNGVVYKTESGYIQTAVREPIADLDSILFPSYEGLPVEKEMSYATPLSGFNTFYADEPRLIQIMYSRSCPFKCSFCFHPTGDSYRTRSMDNFFKELDMYVGKYDINGIVLVDECFRMDDSVFEFCRRMKPYNLKWVVSLVAKTVTYEKLLALKDAGCCSVSYGIESMSEAVLKDMRKPADVKTIERALELTMKAGISIQGNLIFGAEAESAETVKETLGWWLKNRNYQLALNIVTPYPGSAYYDNCVKRGVIKDKREYIELGCPWVNMSKLSDLEFERLITLISLPSDAKLAWDFACHSEVIETIPDYKGDANCVSMKLKCFHCGEIHTYGNLPKPAVSGAFYMPCRSCGRLSTYGDYPNFSYALLCQWAKNEINGVKLSSWISENGFKNIVIYGLGELAVVLYKYLENTGVSICVTDKNPNAATNAYTFMRNAKFVSVQNLASVNADLALIAPSYGKQQIQSFLRENGFKGRSETLFDVVFGIVDCNPAARALVGVGQ